MEVTELDDDEYLEDWLLLWEDEEFLSIAGREDLGIFSSKPNECCCRREAS